MRKMIFSLFLLLFTVLIMLLSIAGPELFARYRDKAILGQIYTRAMESDGEGYRYTLSPGEKLYILSECFPKVNNTPLPGTADTVIWMEPMLLC